MGEFYRRRGKRMLDTTIAAAALPVALPLVLAGAVGLWLSDRGPVLYRQMRVGHNGQPFALWKLRTMRRDAEADGRARWALEDDPRATRVGRWLRAARIDELPQLWNVLRGEMSLCGPRPERPEFVARLGGEVPMYVRRHAVRPGLTGWAQLRLESPCSVVAKTRRDLWYTEHVSLAADVRILLRTPRAIYGAVRRLGQATV